MVPIALRAEGWADLYTIIILPFLILGIFESIIGLYISIKENINKLIIGYIGLLYLLFGSGLTLFFYYYTLTLIIPGIILTLLGFYNEFY
ncbi:MAG: hypothetical protein ACFFDH_06080 [Promethearchaeota archaeon]